MATLDHPMKTPTPVEIATAQTEAGGWTRETLAGWGVPWPPPKGWRAELERRGRLEALAKWLLSMDDPDDPVGVEDRRRVTLTQIIARAQEALDGVRPE